MPRVFPASAPRLCLSVVLLTTSVCAACSEPPSREMHQAQGAIDAARAAGAEQYAATELKSAVDALARSEEAVTANDYRLALAHALDSREYAQSAAKAAVDARARARGDAERELAEAAAIVQRLETRLKDPAAVRLPRRTVAPVNDTVARATTSLQEARAALEKEEYEGVQQRAATLTTEVQAALAALDKALAPASRSRSR